MADQCVEGALEEPFSDEAVETADDDADLYPLRVKFPFDEFWHVIVPSDADRGFRSLRSQFEVENLVALRPARTFTQP